MATHVCKDFLGLPPYTANFAAAYFAALFIRGVLGFTQVGHTNFNVTGSTITKASGTGADINLGPGLERAVSIPAMTYTLSVSDISRIIALRSSSNPLFNSGLFRIVGIDTATNSVFLSGRLADTPKVESNLTWTIFETEAVALAGFSVAPSTPTTSGLYHGTGNAGASRVILQSPHTSAWQVRITCENTADTTGGGTPYQNKIGARVSFAPGYDGDSAGDFLAAGRHLHVPMFWNKAANGSDATTFRTNGSVVGIPSNRTIEVGLRYYMWGDDVTGTFAMFVRQHTSVNTSDDQGLVFFGLAEDEEQSPSGDNVHRLFTYGYNNTQITGQTIQISPDFGELNGTIVGQMGVAYGLSMQPVSCVPMSYNFLAGNAIASSIMFNAAAADNVYTGATELYGMDLITGTWDSWFAAATSTHAPNMILEPRRLGRMPFVRKGRANFNNWSVSPDTLWLHTENGVYMPWSGSYLP